MSKTCSDCVYWEFVYESLGERFGICSEVMVQFKIKVDIDDEIDQKAIYTEQYFGCNHFRENDGIVTEINLDDDDEDE
jgi:hypothetical protein